MAKTSQNRVNRTRSALLSAGFQLMADRTVDAISIDELVETASVGKGSFFNHFGDKEGFKHAIALELRADIEHRIDVANAHVVDPLEKLAGGMREVANYVLDNKSRTVAMLRVSVGASAEDHPMNKGVRADIEGCIEAGLILDEAGGSGVLYWLGLCVALITKTVECDLSRDEASELLCEIVLLGLRGLGADESAARQVAEQCSRDLRAS